MTKRRNESMIFEIAELTLLIGLLIVAAFVIRKHLVDPDAARQVEVRNAIRLTERIEISLEEGDRRALTLLSKYLRENYYYSKMVGIAKRRIRGFSFSDPVMIAEWIERHQDELEYMSRDKVFKLK